MSLIMHVTLIATCIFAIYSMANSVELQDAYSTHISVPVVVTVGESLEYFFDDDLIISGWVEYNNNPTPDVLLNIKVFDQNRIQVSDTFVNSDSNGEFQYVFSLPDDSIPGNYTVIITSMCWEQHRQICAHNTAQVVVNVSKDNTHIPKWVKIVAKFWVDGQIDDDMFTRAVEFLIQNNIIHLGNLDKNTHDKSDDVPDWIKESTGHWVSGVVSDDEFAASMKWLINNGIISTNA